MRTTILAIIVLAFGFQSDSNAQQPTLKDAYKGCFLVGAALNPVQFSGADPREDTLIKAQFNTISPENVLKWEIAHPRPDTYDFSLADKYVEFGQQSHMFIIGHNLVWHSQVPKWVFEDEKGAPVTREVLLERMRDHISKVVGRYKGRIAGWDVVNEALNEDGTMRQSPWLKIIGDDFIEQAFRYAHEADPQAELYYNDYSLENEAKRKGALELVKKLKAKGIAITGVGTQGHFSLDSPTTDQVDSTIVEFGKLGVKVMITELDVPKLNPYANGLPDAVQQQLSKRYADLFVTFASHCGLVSRVTFWGVTDKESWKNNWPVRGRTDYPLLFNRDAQPKPAFGAVIQAAPKSAS